MDNNVIINTQTPIKFEPQQPVTIDDVTVAVTADTAHAHEQKNAQILSREARMFNDSIGTGHVLVKSVQDPNLTKTVFIDNDTIKRNIGKDNLFVDTNGVKFRAIKLDANIKTDPDLMRANDDATGSMGLRNV